MVSDTDDWMINAARRQAQEMRAQKRQADAEREVPRPSVPEPRPDSAP
jgi:hypothetical protein